MESPRYGIGVCGISLSNLIIIVLSVGLVLVNLQNRKIGKEIQANIQISEKSSQEEARLLHKCDSEKIALQNNVNTETSQKDQIQKQIDAKGKDIDIKTKLLEELKKTKTDLEAQLTAAAAEAKPK